jgi:hypothetical protein
MPNIVVNLRRILLTADTVGGVWTYALELAHLLHQHDIQVVLATMGGFLMDCQRAEIRNIRGLTLFESSFKLEWMQEPWSEVAQAGDWLLELADVTQPDIVHLNSYVFGALDWCRPMLVVGHSCVLSRWATVKGEPVPASWERYRREVARGLHAADLVVAPTQAMLAELERYYGCFVRSRVIPHGRNPARFPPAAKQPFIFAVGRLWDEAKNIGKLDQIAPSLAWPAYVAGEERHPVGWEVRYRSVRELGQLSPPMLAH